jgi:hypothetical protein
MEVSGQRHAPAVLYPGDRTPGTHCTGGWASPRAGLDADDRGKIPCLCRGSNPYRPVRSQDTVLTELPRLLLLLHTEFITLCVHCIFRAKNT